MGHDGAFARATTTAPRDFTGREPQIKLLTAAGHPLRVAVWPGDGTRTPLLMFNGIGAPMELLAAFIAEVDPRREVVVFDAPGVGESPAPRLPYRPWMLAIMTERLLDAMGYEQVDVMGFSWGGTIAQQFALQDPRRCRRLILAATTPGAFMVPGKLKPLMLMASPRRHRDPAFLRANFGPIYGGAAYHSKKLVRDYARRAKPKSWRGYLYQQLALVGWTSLPLLPLLRQPTLILAGDDDQLVPLLSARLMASLIPRSRLTIYPDGHLFIISRAGECAAEVEAFLEEPDSKY